MNSTAAQIDRLLRAAAALPNEIPPEMPFGFDTRVVALWRVNWPGDPAGLARLLRRVMLIAAALIVLASAGAYRELILGDEPGELFGDEYEIADSAIGGVFDQ
ncbi:MAG: hypothetical protein H0X34_07705 [Chthoniobacterales bacterium]|nr:hypothetical protein [Chthoniobacterales bacterium]